MEVPGGTVGPVPLRLEDKDAGWCRSWWVCLTLRFKMFWADSLCTAMRFRYSIIRFIWCQDLITHQDSRHFKIIIIYNIPGWWFGTCFIFPYIGNSNPDWRTHIFFSGVGIPPIRYTCCSISWQHGNIIARAETPASPWNSKSSRPLAKGGLENVGKVTRESQFDTYNL